MKVRVFIASSLEGRNVAYAIKDYFTAPLAEATVWDQDVFEPSSFTLEALLERLEESDVGIFVFSPDDIARIRGKEYSVTRDNVLFELGLFIGHLGRKRNFIVRPQGLEDFRLPTDLAGLTTLQYEASREDGNLTAGGGSAANKIRNALQTFASTSAEHGPRPGVRGPASKGRLGLNVPEQFMIGHYMGNPMASIFTGLLNLGEQPLVMRKLVCILRHENGATWQLPGQSYMSRQMPTQPGQNAPESRC